MSVGFALLRVLSYILTLLGAAAISHAGVAWWMVTSGAVHPGEPMFLDEIAPSQREALEMSGVGFLMVVCASWFRRWKTKGA